MNELPNELICIIFRHLNLTDLFNNCRLVSKRLLGLVDSMKFQELIMLNPNPFNFDPLCYLTDHSETKRRINLNNVLFFNVYKFGTFKIKFNNFSDLKFLNFDFSNDDCELKFEIESLNKFVQLEHLIIAKLRLILNSTLCLPNLKTFSLTYHYRSLDEQGDNLLIDAIRLERVKFYDFQNLINKFVHPESIKFLICSSKNMENGFKVFNNLEVCRIEFKFFHTIDRNDLVSRLPNNLKELHLDYNQYEFGLFLRNNVHYFRYLLDEKIELNQTFNLYVNEIELIRNRSIMRQILECEKLYKRLYKSRFENYKKITKLPRLFKMDLDYNELIRFFKVIPDDFYIKFNLNINTIAIRNVDQEIDQDQFIWFLNGCSNLRTLYIYEDRNMCIKPLDQQFYNQLPKSASLLSSLEIHFKSEEFLINFEFISEFKILELFKTNQYIPLEDAEKLVKYNHFLRDFSVFNEISSFIILKFKLGEFITYHH